MASILAGDDLARTMGSRRMSRTGSIRGEGWGGPDINGFSQPTGKEEDEEELRWAAIECLPTYDRVRRGMLEQVLDGKVVKTQIDVTKLGTQDRKLLVENILKSVGEDNENFLKRLRERTDKVGIEVSTIEVRYENLSVEGDV
ncbi:hypothetical protein Tsubulata_005577 [Turnera subulata]|uniref:Pleiotropic ABC efflux transporter N-terminal domain-containing protein n=1 Tax=Turnera subulata TaxID=218843 RepID=A0A9Q0F2E4_9ROSI|nr:hypothetical protein Tsubulata_005577 [Turnera subulata]